MENRGSMQQTDNERRCQVEGCTDVTVGARTSLCRKHRNNKYKQNYKKKKRKAQGAEDNPGESLESQLAVEKFHLEQKYASMLQQVLVQKRLELLQSPSICNLLRIHQQNVRQNKQIELTEKRKAAQNQCNSKTQQEKHSKSHSSSESSSSCSSTICSSSAATTKPTSTSSKAASSNKTFTKSSKQSSRPTQGRNNSKNSKNRNNMNSGVESSINRLGTHLKSTSSICNESVEHPVYVSSGAWVPVEEKREFCDLRQVQNFQLQQVAPQKMLHHTKQQSLQQQKQQQQQQPLRNMQVQQPEVLLQHCQQRNISKQQLQHLQHQKLLEQLHQKHLHDQQENEQKQQQFRHQQQKREQLVQQQHQQHFLQQRRLQQQRQHELHIQLQNNRQQQLQPQQQHQQQLQQHQQLQQRQVTVHQNQHQVQFQQKQQQQQQQQQQQHQHPQNSSVAQSVKNVSGTELLLQTLPSIQSCLSTLPVSQSNINTTSSHDVNSTAGTRPSVIPRTVLSNTQGRTQNANSINHMVSNAPSVSSHRPIAPRLEGHPSDNNTLCNGGMPIITAIISAPLTQQIMSQNASNVERNSLHLGSESNTLTSINSFGNAFNNHYPLMQFNVQMDKWI